MAEGFLRHLAGDHFNVFSAGTEKTEVRPEAIMAMRKWDVDISGQQSKTLNRFLGETWDYVITVCDAANESCPVFPGARHRLHWSFPDPSAVTGSRRQAAFDAVATDIHARLQEWLKGQSEPPGDARASS